MNQQTTEKTEQNFSHRYLRVQDLHNLRNQMFVPKRVIEGLYAGKHATPQRGHSVEFNDYREYVPGDDIADIDWKVYGRSDRLYIKQFEHQADMTVNILIDASASMNYAGYDAKVSNAKSGSWISKVKSVANKFEHSAQDRAFSNPTKYDQACLMAAAIAFLTIKQQDRVSFGLSQKGLLKYHPPQNSFRHLTNILRTMERQPILTASLAESIQRFSERASRRGLFIIFSDLLEDQNDIAKALSLLTHRGMEIIVFQTLHKDELHLPDLGEAIFIDAESNQRLRLATHDIRNEYNKKIKQRLDSYARLFRSQGIDHNIVTTNNHYAKALEGYLFHRGTRA
ncbi:DUF58 domain-containing protein [Planctomycetota bacterium]|nr:DUF58 domain-containing protein [Planctomycetota bacterium]